MEDVIFSNKILYDGHNFYWYFYVLFLSVRDAFLSYMAVFYVSMC